MSILDWSLKETGYAIVAIKTTGLTHGYDKICEISVVLAVPGQPIRLVLDTIVNPERRLAAVEVHGIKTHQITNSTPTFREVALDLLRAIQGRVLVGHNLHFTMHFLRSEFADLGIAFATPYLDTMALTSMLSKKPPRPLFQACEQMGMEARLDPTSSAAALDTAMLFRALLSKLKGMHLNTFKHIAGKQRLSYQQSLDLEPMKKGLAYELKESVLRVSRHEDGVEGTPNIALALFWDALMVVLDDRKITESEMAYLTDLRGELEIGLEDVYMLHARAFAGALVAMIDSGECSETDRAELQDLHGCLTLLGWAPGSASLSPDEHTEEQ